MKTITLTLSDDEYEVLAGVVTALDPSGSLKVSSVAKGMLCEGMGRQAFRLGVDEPPGWKNTDAHKRYLAKLG